MLPIFVRMRNGVHIVFLLLLFLLTGDAYSQRAPLKIEHRKEGVVVLKLVLCNPKDEEYCLVAHDIYFRKHAHTLTAGTMERLEGQSAAYPIPENIAKQLLSTYKAHQGFHNIAATGFFSPEILASGNGWSRFKTGSMFLPKSVGNFNWNTVYIIYKVRGTFAFAGKELSPLFKDLYNFSYQNQRFKEPVHYPLVEALSIESFKPLTKKEARKLGMKYCTMPWYRLNVIGLNHIIDQTGVGQRDIHR